MELRRFRVTNFRCFVDSGWVIVDDPLLPFVGKNEAGKSALLIALASLSGDAELDHLRDWPRSKSLDDFSEISPVVEGVFDLSMDERSELSKIDKSLGELVSFSVTKRYGGARVPRLDAPPTPRLAPELITALNQAVGEPRPSAAKSWAQSILTNSRANNVGALSRSLRGLVAASDESDAIHDAKALIASHADSLDAIHARADARQWLIGALPDFVYFDAYALIAGELNLTMYQPAGSNDDIEQGQRLFALACELSGVDLARLSSLNPSDSAAVTERGRMIDEASMRMTEAVARIWHQRDVKANFLLDGPTLRIHVSDSIETRSVPLDHRSMGFRSFYSFYVLFEAQASGVLENAVLLLDEPGQSLHGLAQQDLVHLMIDLSKRNQIIYTTHSPFMLDRDSIDNVCVVEATSAGSGVADSLWAADSDNSFPVQTALGFDIAQTFFGHDKQLIVEGTSDYYLLMAINQLLVNSGKPDRLADISIVPANGASKVPSVVTVSLGQGHSVRVVLDLDGEGSTTETELTSSSLLKRNAISRVAPLDSSQRDGSMKEVLGEKLYKQFAAAAYKRELAALPAAPRVASVGRGHPQIGKRVEEAYSKVGIKLNKTRVARWLSRQVADGQVTVSAEALQHFEAFIEAILATTAYRRR